MARTELDRAVLPSLLDRLTDEAPSQASDPPVSREESTRLFRQSVQRDLDSLLNSRRTIVMAGEGVPEVARSVHQYGIADFAGLTTSDAGWRDRLLENIRDSIRLFEPRLANVNVTLVGSEASEAQQVRFSVSATLLMDPSPEQVVFDTLLEVSSGAYVVQEQP